jgi:hypothetical protein
MRFKKLRLIFLLKIILISILLIFSLSLIVSKGARRYVFSYFNTHCLDYRQRDYSRRLNDRIVDYSAAAKLKGIKPCKDDAELKKKVSEGKLVKVRSSNRYLIDNLTYSSPYVTKETKLLIEEIAQRFREKVSEKGIKGSRFIITSMTRKTESLRSLRRNNGNASVNSPHFYGNAFDISYKRFIARKWILTNCDKKYLKDALGEVIFELRQEKKCWATYERVQNCYHVVAR